MSRPTHRADLRRADAAERRRTLTTVFHSFPYLMAFALHMSAVLWLVGVFGGTAGERTLLAAALLLAALLLLLATPSSPRPPRNRRRPRRDQPRARTPVRRSSLYRPL